MSENGTIRPRTGEERKALLTGYAMAVNDIAEHGLKFGSDQVRLMVDSEERMGNSVLDSGRGK